MKRDVEEGKVRLWRERLKRFAEEGKTGVEFCRQEGIALATFYKWKRRLAEGEGMKITPQTKPRVGVKGGMFQAVEVAATGVAVRVRLPDGCVIEVGHDRGAMEWVLGKILDRQGGDAC